MKLNCLLFALPAGSYPRSLPVQAGDLVTGKVIVGFHPCGDATEEVAE